MKYIIFLLWFLLVVAWNYLYQDALWYEDVIVAVCLSLWSKSLDKHLV